MMTLGVGFLEGFLLYIKLFALAEVNVLKRERFAIKECCLFISIQSGKSN